MTARSDSLGATSSDLVKPHLSTDAIPHWLEQIPLYSRIAYLHEHRVPADVINRMRGAWKDWRQGG